MSNLRTLYPPIEPFNKGFLQVSPLHLLYFEESGNPQGKPAVVLHGGPGGGSVPSYRQFFCPHNYRIVVFDQRGSGKSTPHAELKDNTTKHLVEDIEKLREHLNIEKWVVFGGSWGSTLSLAYAEAHMDRVKALVLRGIFTLRREELIWFYQEGASFIYPDAWEDYIAPIPEVERGDLMSAYYRRLTGEDEEVKIKCARAWSKWEMITSRLHPNMDDVKKVDDDKFALAFARIECHYFVNGGFFSSNGELLAGAKNFEQSHMPGVIVQGRYDLVCPMKSAWDLHRAWPSAKLHIVQDAGHSVNEPGIVHHLIEATDSFKDL